jgi:hypothetical protein
VDKRRNAESMRAMKNVGGGENLVRKSEGKNSLLRSRRKWKDNIKMYLKNGGCEGVNWFQTGQDKNPLP